MASPFTVPVSSAVPNVPLYVPVSFSPACLKTKVGVPLPADVSTLKVHFPLISCAKAAAHINAAIVMVRKRVNISDLLSGWLGRGISESRPVVNRLGSLGGIPPGPARDPQVPLLVSRVHESGEYFRIV